MPILKPTGLTGEVVFLGRVADRSSTLKSTGTDSIFVNFEGVEGESHWGHTRASCARVTSQYPLGTEIRNTRQLSIVSSEELEVIRARMDLDHLPPEWIGASIVVEGIPDFTLIPPSSRLIFASGASLVADMENAPCSLPARVIETESPGKGKLFKAAAQGIRGVTAWVERPGAIALGDRFRLHAPPQRIYPHID